MVKTQMIHLVGSQVSFLNYFSLWHNHGLLFQQKTGIHKWVNTLIYMPKWSFFKVEQNGIFIPLVPSHDFNLLMSAMKFVVVDSCHPVDPIKHTEYSPSSSPSNLLRENFLLCSIGQSFTCLDPVRKLHLML